HGGVKIGQGLYTKIRVVTETSTNKVPNASTTAASATDAPTTAAPATAVPATAASVCSDLNGMVILNACHQMNER
ncbi:hypothetical protein L0F63_004963, partial [Massospora cicadina]